ncbi:alkB, alkylation repair homolog 7 (E. coli) [Nesidiocoris tenuis]|uniref:AlkB, alkylation repair homolog 7 (E. coli) n=1 Tax=Nesidiocoris tenuis TaxID=355587 RepID=A0ABN7B307_9HEMI|nr:alkB, alkylation repair homolog 7 (E. coli) [Nesidiocoris tenuis]
MKEFLNLSSVPQDQVPAILENFILVNDFISEDEELSLMKEIEPKLRRMRYQYDHWDDAIHGFRETEQVKWADDNLRVLDRVRATAFPETSRLLPHVHVLDLADNGWIKPHIDSIKFCGSIITGLSLLTDSVMKLDHEMDEKVSFTVLLKRRSLYIMRGVVRYNFKHAILRNEESYFNDRKIDKQRRVSVICRNEPDESNS